MRRLHVTGSQDKRERKKAVAPYARLMAKASHSVPLAVCEILAQHVRFPPHLQCKQRPTVHRCSVYRFVVQESLFHIIEEPLHCLITKVAGHCSSVRA